MTIVDFPCHLPHRLPGDVLKWADDQGIPRGTRIYVEDWHEDDKPGGTYIAFSSTGADYQNCSPSKVHEMLTEAEHLISRHARGG